MHTNKAHASLAEGGLDMIRGLGLGEGALKAPSLRHGVTFDQ